MNLTAYPLFLLDIRCQSPKNSHWVDPRMIIKVFVLFLNNGLQEKRRNLFHIGFQPPFVLIVEVSTQYPTFIIQHHCGVIVWDLYWKCQI